MGKQISFRGINGGPATIGITAAATPNRSISDKQATPSAADLKKLGLVGGTRNKIGFESILNFNLTARALVQMFKDVGAPRSHASPALTIRWTPDGSADAVRKIGEIAGSR